MTITGDDDVARRTPASGRTSVALVDDHQLVRQGISAWLGVGNGQVEVLASVPTVHDLRGTPGWGAEVVLLDLSLDDGSTVEQNLAALAGMSRVVVVSAITDPVTVRRAVAAGAMGYVAKSACAEDMLAAIRAVASGAMFMNQDLARVLLEADAPVRPGLSPQELQALRLYAGGMPMKSVARRMGVKEGTVKSYLDRIREKYARAGREARTKLELYRRGTEDGYLEP